MSEAKIQPLLVRAGGKKHPVIIDANSGVVITKKEAELLQKERLS